MNSFLACLLCFPDGSFEEEEERREEKTSTGQGVGHCADIGTEQSRRTV